MIKVGLTGNRYSGKTEISAMFRKIGVPVFDVDTCIKFLINHNFEYNLKLQKRLSYDVWDENGFLSQKKLTTEQLDSAIDIIQFELFDLFEKFTKRNFHSPYYVFTSSILFE